MVICNKFTHLPLVCCWSYRPRCGVADATCCKPVTLMVWYVSSSRSSRNIRRGQVTKQCISCAIRGALVPEPDANVAGKGHARPWCPSLQRRDALPHAPLSLSAECLMHARRSRAIGPTLIKLQRSHRSRRQQQRLSSSSSSHAMIST